MRDIKFRLWNPKCNVLTAGNDFETLLITTDINFVKEFNESKMIWMQYTGLKDKNGKEIYEGDIVRFFDAQKAWRNGVELPTFLDCIIVWDNKELSYEPLTPDNSYFHPGCRGAWLGYFKEVIGNVHENKDLLK